MKARFSLQLGLTLVLFFGVQTAFAQNGIFELRAGYLNPKDAKGGLMLGGTFGTAVDEAVDIGVGFDIFHNSYSDESAVATDDNNNGLDAKTYVTSVDYTRTLIPLNLVVNVKLPAGRYFGYIIRGGIGYQFLISKEKNYELDKTETRKFGGLGLQAGAGLYYHVGSRSTVTADVFFNSCKVSRSIDSAVRGLPTTERVDLTGIGFRLGVIIDMR